LTSKAHSLFRVAYPIATLLLATLAPAPARADFFDDMRKTFTTDIPHFFQDDVPCAFGGQPTSGAKKSCKSGDRPAKPATDKDQGAAVPPEKPKDAGNPPPSSGR
jgi:hypothetical protein